MDVTRDWWWLAVVPPQGQGSQRFTVVHSGWPGTTSRWLLEDGVSAKARLCSSHRQGAAAVITNGKEGFAKRWPKIVESVKEGRSLVLDRNRDRCWTLKSKTADHGDDFVVTTMDAVQRQDATPGVANVEKEPVLTEQDWLSEAAGGDT
ncbi:hypothetical protein NL676_028601 [Syzygium grande]|nr:hypothetical protein NL676_028601 [Syzygium grande]